MDHRKSVIWFLFPFTVSALMAQTPAWFTQPQFFDISDFYFNPNPTLLQIPFTGQEWGLNLPIDATNAVSAGESEIANWHRPYFCAVTTCTVFPAQLATISPDGTPPASWDSFRTRTLSGAYLDYLSAPEYSLSSSVYQAFLIAQAEGAVDLGADGVMFDNVGEELRQLVYESPQNAGSFDSASMAAFSIYLQQKYSASVLQSQFGITDVTTFNLGTYINSNGLAATWNQPPLAGLSLEYFLFKRQEELTFLKNLVTTTKQYALQKYNRNFLFSCNTAFVPLNEFVRDSMDMTTGEFLYIRGQEQADHPYAAPNIRAWKGWKAPVLLLPEAFPPGSSASPLSMPTVNLERVIIADIQASGGVPSMTAEMNSGLGYPEPVDLSVVDNYVNFILNNPELTSNLSTSSKIALLESAASEVNSLFSTGQPNAYNGQMAYMGTARILLDSGYTYDSVFLPDTSYSSLSSPSAQDFAKYSVIVAPLVWALDDTQLSSLLSYVQQGGTLVISGAFGTNLPNGQLASRPQLQAILPTSGASSYGAGTIVVSSELFGVEYEQWAAGTQGVAMNTQIAARSAFQTILGPYIEPEVQVSGVTAVIHQPGVTPFLYHDPSGNAILHLVNYDYDDSTDQFYNKTDVGLSLNVGTQTVNQVILSSPDITGTQSLPFTQSGANVTLTVPEVDAWDVLQFEEIPTTTRLINISTRAQVGTGGNILIPGFVIGGNGMETLLIRADGPSLTGFGVSGVLAQPSLIVTNSAGAVVASNTGWGTNSNPSLIASTAASVGAFALAPGSADCAVIVSLPPGAYTVQVSGVGNTTGVALAEVYEVASNGTRLINISTRAQVGTGGNILIPGFVIGGSGSEELLVRADGPGLTPFGVAGVLAQPSLSVINNTGVTVASNTGWGTNSISPQIASTAASVGAFALTSGSADSATTVYLAPGAYTMQVSGVKNATGVALAEVYEVQNN